MRILVDTQCWIWMTASPERFSPEARALVETTEHDLYLSAASSWEIAIRYSIGKLKLPYLLGNTCWLDGQDAGSSARD